MTTWITDLERREREAAGEEARLQLDRLAVSGTLTEQPRRRPYVRAGLGVIGIVVCVLGVAAVIYGRFG